MGPIQGIYEGQQARPGALGATDLEANVSHALEFLTWGSWDSTMFGAQGSEELALAKQFLMGKGKEQVGSETLGVATRRRLRRAFIKKRKKQRPFAQPALIAETSRFANTSS